MIHHSHTPSPWREGRGGAIILADGDFPTSPEPLRLLSEASFVCCCDGAAEKLIAHGRIPDAIVGDGDSLSADFKARYKDIIHAESEQEYNDLTKATRFVISRFPKSPLHIVYLGATGKREDHTLGNISLLSFYKETFGIDVSMYTDYGFFQANNSGTTTFSSFPRQQVSIFNINCTAISADGLRWQPYAYTQLWQGTLNEATGSVFTITADGSYITYQTYAKKPRFI